MQKIRTDQSTLRFAQCTKWLQHLFHFRGARLENIEQVSVTALKIVEHVLQLLCGGLGIEPKHTIGNMVRPGLIGRVEVAWLRRQFEGSHDDPGRIRAQIQNLAIRKIGIETMLPPGLVRDSIGRAAPITNSESGFVRSPATARLNSLNSTRPIRYDNVELGALVLVDPIRMKAIRATARIGIDECRPQVVFAQKPTKRAHRACRPLRASIGAPCDQARRKSR